MSTSSFDQSMAAQFMFTPFKQHDDKHELISKHQVTINLPLETISAELREEKFRYFAIHIMNSAYESMPVPTNLEFPFKPNEPVDVEHDFEMCLLYRHTLRWLLVNGYVTSSELMNSLSDPFDFHKYLFRSKGAGTDIIMTDKGLLAVERVVEFHNTHAVKAAKQAGKSFTRDMAASGLGSALASGGPAIWEMFSKLIGN